MQQTMLEIIAREEPGEEDREVCVTAISSNTSDHLE